MTTKIMVLGANSFSAQDFVDLLLDNPDYDVRGVTRSPEPGPLFIKHIGRPERDRYQHHQLDFNEDMPELLALFDSYQPDYIVNFAAQGHVGYSWNHPERWLMTNAVAIAQMTNHLRQQDYLGRWLQISSPEIYGSNEGAVTEETIPNPSTPYATSKLAGDLILKNYHNQYNFPVMLARATNVYGSRQRLYRIIPRTIVYAKLGRTLYLQGGGQAVKSYIHIRDISRGYLDILERGRVGDVYHLSPDDGQISIRNLVKLVCDRLGVDFDALTEDTEERPGQDKAYINDSSKARRELGWQPTIDMETGIQEVIDWVNQYWDEIQNGELDYQFVP